MTSFFLISWAAILQYIDTVQSTLRSNHWEWLYIDGGTADYRMKPLQSSQTRIFPTKYRTIKAFNFPNAAYKLRFVSRAMQWYVPNS